MCADSLLQQFGGAFQNTLGNIISAHDPDDFEVSTINKSPYYSLEHLPSCIRKTDTNFTILTLNVESILSKIDQLRILLNILKNENVVLDAVCIQESWLPDDYTSSTGIIQLDDYTCIPQGYYCGRKGGLITYIHSKYKVTKLDIGSKSNIWEHLIVDVYDKVLHSHIIVGNIYKPPRNNNNNENIDQFLRELDPLLQKLDTMNYDIALAGDYNINLLKINERLKFSEFFDKMLSHSLYPKITLPTRIGVRSATLIDNIYCKLSPNTIDSSAGILFTNLSDHLPSFLCIQRNFNFKTKKPPKLAKQKLNSPNAMENLKSELINIDITSKLNPDLNMNPNENYNHLIKVITETKEKHFPNKMVKFNKHRHKNNKWITYAIIKSIAYRDKLHLKKKKTNPLTDEYAILDNNLKVYNSILKKTIREAKVKYYDEIFEKYKYDIKNTWKHISEILNKSNKKKNQIVQIVVDGNIIQDKELMANKFNDFFANIGSKLASTIDTTNKKPFNSYLNKMITTSFVFNLLTPEETNKIIKSLKTKTSTGDDGISVKLMKYLAPALINALTLIINQSLITGIFPDQLKIAKVIPLYKKDNADMVNNYRPVSLLNALSKVFEKAAFNQLYKYFKENKLFYKNQYGFRDEHSTELASLELIDRVINDLDKKKNPVTVYMDLSKAFDTLDHSILLHKLKFYGISGFALSWFQSYLTNRYQYVSIDNTKSTLLPLDTGVPQGSILGPLLFLIYMNDIPSSSDYFDFILYADDTSLKSFISTRDPTNKTQVSDKINHELTKINDWLAVNKLSLNVAKTKFMIFHTKKNVLPIIPDLKIGNAKLERVTNFNFLGLLINDNLSWKPHTDYIANKISKYVGVLNRLKKFLPSHILKTLYFSLVQSNLNYSLLAWGYNCGRLKNIKKKAIRIISQSKYNAHTEPIMKSLGILKLEDLFKLNMLKWYYRFVKNKVPEYFSDFEILNQSDRHTHNTRLNMHILQPRTRLIASRHCLRNHISTIINATPTEIIQKINTHSYKGYSNYIKKKYLEGYSADCSIENCYICARHI